MSTNSKHFNLHWQRFDHYWLAVFSKTSIFPPEIQQVLEGLGMRAVTPDAMAMKVPRQWKMAWDMIYFQLQQGKWLETVDASIMPSDAGETLELVAMDRRPVSAVQAIADSLWLGDALISGNLMCYMQPVMSGPGKIFGYESFARVKTASGEVVGGDKIMSAGKTLNIEYMIDRHLHVEAIKTFVSSQFNGFLFVNFFPGFILRPAVYLEGLSETARSFGMVAKNLVLDFTKSEVHRDMAHLRSVCEYGRSKGYSLALDDIESLESARKLVPEVRPDFVKIDMQLVSRIGEESIRSTIRQIVEIAHANGASVIGEGVESEDTYHQLKSLGVDLFQGYFFSAPQPVESALKNVSAGTN